MQINVPEFDFTFEDFEIQAVDRLNPESQFSSYTNPSAFWINKQGNYFDYYKFASGIFLNHLYAGDTGEFTDTFNMFSFTSPKLNWNVVCSVTCNMSRRQIWFRIHQENSSLNTQTFFVSGLMTMGQVPPPPICLITSYDIARQHYVIGFVEYKSVFYGSVIYRNENYIEKTIQRDVNFEQLYARNSEKIVNHGISSNSFPDTLTQQPIVYGAENFSENAGHTTSNNNYNDDTSNNGGGGGSYNQNSDPIADDSIPTNHSLNTGFIKAYNPTTEQIQSLSTFLLSDDFIQNVSKLFDDPMNYIIGMLMLPITPTISGVSRISCGGVDTGVDANLVSNQFAVVDMGSVSVSEKWGGFLDYAPNTSVKIFLPFIGFRDLEIDDVMNATLTLKYKVDVLTGACVASIKCNTNKKLNSVVYYFDGNMALPCSITAVDYSSRYNAILNAISGVGSAGVSAVAGNPLGVVGGVISTANAVLGSKPIVQRSGNITGNAGIVSQFTPFVIISRPTQSLSSNYKSQIGYPSNIGGKISKFKGYTEFESTQLNGISCTDYELKKIENMLKEGVYL